MGKQISDRARLLVFQKYEGRCAYCGCEISYNSFQIDHIHPKSGYIETENGKPVSPNRIENLNPSCRSCNHYKHFYSVSEFKMYLKQMFETKQQYLFKSMTKFELAKKYGVIVVSKWDGLFYFERVKQ
jgi:CRISPR/Cas system Type II protein with McrA/HNH and RuvC-like nuclease domain